MDRGEFRAELQQRVVAHVQATDYRPVKPRVILKQLGLHADHRADLKRVLKRLVKQGQIAYGPDHLVLPVQATPQQSTSVTGVFRRAAGGYGFVRPQAAKPEVGRELDIFVPLRRSGDAASGDRVRVAVTTRTQHGEVRRTGRILEVLERQTHTFVGVYRERQGSAHVRVDGNLFPDPVPVGDPGAKGAQGGDKVVIEMVRFPSHWQPGEGVVVEILGPRGAPGVETLSILREFGLDETFSETVLESAREQAERFDEAIGDRLDLTQLTVVTIDPADARDFDDAISLERLPGGNWRLGIHIADVAHFVPVDSPLDQEARLRGTSVYLTDRVVPMLPEIISNNLASLQPERVRYARTVFVELDAEGVRLASEVHRSAICSDRRFTYEEVDDFLADRAIWSNRLRPDVHRLLGEMHELGMQLRRRRLDQGAIELTLPEIKIELDRQGKMTGARLLRQTESHQLIEEFMLVANQAVAEQLADDQRPFLRRVHPPPTPRKLHSLTRFVRSLGIECDSLESRFEIKRVIASVQQQPAQHPVNMAVLRSMQKAVYGPQDEGHYALHSRHYTHFTSPIRRYPDLVVHRLLDALAAGQTPDQTFPQLAELGGHCSDREQRAEAAERQHTKVKLLEFLSHRIGSTLPGVITGVEKVGLFVQGLTLPAEGLVPIATLADDHYRFDADSYSLVGYREDNAFRLGDRIEVSVVHVDVDRRELDFRLAEGGGRQGSPRRPRPKSGGRPRAGGKPARGARSRRKGKKRTR